MIHSDLFFKTHKFCSFRLFINEIPMKSLKNQYSYNIALKISLNICIPLIEHEKKANFSVNRTLHKMHSPFFK